MSEIKKQMVPDAANTYCNPLSIPNIPYGYDERMIKEKAMFNLSDLAPEDFPAHRSISDPTVFFHDNKWYLYPSYGMAWVTEDFVHWKHHETTPYCPKYSPCITKWKDKFLFTSWFSPLYVGDSPLGPFELLGDYILPDGTHFTPCDPAIFTDDDGRIYLYAFNDEPLEGSGIHMGTTVGYELDRDNPRQVVQGPIVVMRMNPRENWWERNGFDNQDTRFGWVEGVHMLKYKGRYYCIYASPGTSYGSYAMAVYYSDEGPLSGFTCQKKNPLTFNRHGVVSGAGHGCVEVGPNDTLWAFYTIAATLHHQYERRIGMDLVAVDENGELYCPHGVTDTPQYAPGYMANPIENNSPGYLPLNIHYRTFASSEKPGRSSLYACDGSNLTFWEPLETDEMPSVTCKLTVPYYVGAVRLFWQETGLCYQDDIIPGKVEYMLEGHWQGTWTKIYDNRNETEELNIDYKTFAPVSCDQVRLTILNKPKGVNIGVRDFTVFGVRDMER